MTLDEMFDQINRTTEETHIWHGEYIVQMEVKYTYLEKPEVITTILWHEISYESCITEFMPKGFSWYDDWYHCCKKENVKVLRYTDIDHVFAVNEDRLKKIREWLIDNIFRNPDIMLLSDRDINGIDLPEVIASLYNEYHKAVMGKPYDYMFHWANKCGSWVEEDLFDKVLNESGVNDEEA